ncbi:MAG: hypothetical protein MMC33_000969 [Icmadophila ericetorum]|nr:hypothetical protein [Icmadophila ericetorum]
MPESLLKDANEPLSTFKESIGKLIAYSLVSKNTNGRDFDMHRLVHIISRAWLSLQIIEELSEDEELEDEELSDDEELSEGEEPSKKEKLTEHKKWSSTAIERLYDLWPKDSRWKNWDVCAMYLPHAQAVIRRELDKKSETPGDILEDLVQEVLEHLYGKDDYRTIGDIVLPLLEVWKAAQGDTSPKTLIYKIWLGRMLSETGMSEKAEEVLRQALIYSKELHGTYHVITLDITASLSQDLSYQQKYDEALLLDQQLLEQWMMVLGSDRLDIARSMHNLAVSFENQGKHKEAEV